MPLKVDQSLFNQVSFICHKKIQMEPSRLIIINKVEIMNDILQLQLSIFEQDLLFFYNFYVLNKKKKLSVILKF
jgi:hypothetical protein